MPTVFITGANRGIGLGLTRVYAADGWKVIATARNPAEATELAAVSGDVSGDVTVEKLDVTDHARVKELAQKWKGEPIDILFNNAGVNGRGASAFGRIDPEDLRYAFEVNTFAPILIAEAFVAHVAASEQKKMAFTSSRLGSIGSKGGGGGYAYGASKAALNMECKALSADVRGQGIVVIPFHPGHVATDMGGHGAPVSPEESAKGMKAVLERATLGDSGKFVDYGGEPIPW